MPIDITADLVTEDPTDKSIKKLKLSELPGPIQTELADLLSAVRTVLHESETVQAMIPAPGTSPIATETAYKAILGSAFWLAKVNQGPILQLAGSGSGVSLAPGKDVKGSVWRPQLELWDFFPGAAWELALQFDEAVFSPEFPSDSRVFLNIRPVVADDATFCNYELQLVEERVITGLVLWTAVSRGSKRPAGFATPPRSSRLRSYGRAAFREVRDGMWVSRGPITSDHGQVIVEMAFDGDPPHVRAVTALVDDGPVPSPAPVIPTRGAPDEPFPTVPLPPAVADAGSLDSLGSYAYSKADFFTYRAAKVAQATERRAAKEFFQALDAATQLGSSEVEVSTLGGLLRSQYLRRAEAHHFGGALNLNVEGFEGKKKLAEPAGQLIRSLMQQHLGDDGSGSLESIRTAFDCFASGELTIVDTLGAPNGTNMFSFAELALVLEGEDKVGRIWKRLFPLFAYASEIFVRCYHRCGAPRTHCSYRVENNPTGERAPSQLMKDDIWTLWSDPSPRVATSRYNRLVYTALMDDMETSFGGPGSKDTLAIQDFGCPSSLRRRS